MPNLNQLIISSDTCSIVLTVPTATILQSFPLQTVTKIDFNDAAEGELIYAIGQSDPVGNKSNANKYDGKITMQMGEINALLAVCGFNSSIRIQNAQLSIAALTRGFLKSYKSININTDSSAIEAKGKETLVSLDYLSIGLV